MHRNSIMSTSSTGTEETSDVSISFTKSIEELDHKLKLLENNKPTFEMAIKDTTVYDNKADRWLRSHMNALKQRRKSIEDVEITGHRAVAEFVLRRGHTSDNIERTSKKKHCLLQTHVEKTGNLFIYICV